MYNQNVQRDTKEERWREYTTLEKRIGQKIGYKYEDFVVTTGIGHRAGFAPKSTRENRQVRDTRRTHDETHALKRRQGGK